MSCSSPNYSDEECSDEYDFVKCERPICLDLSLNYPSDKPLGRDERGKWHLKWTYLDDEGKPTSDPISIEESQPSFSSPIPHNYQEIYTNLDYGFNVYVTWHQVESSKRGRGMSKLRGYIIVEFKASESITLQLGSSSKIKYITDDLSSIGRCRCCYQSLQGTRNKSVFISGCDDDSTHIYYSL